MTQWLVTEAALRALERAESLAERERVAAEVAEIEGASRLSRLHAGALRAIGR